MLPARLAQGGAGRAAEACPCAAPTFTPAHAHPPTHHPPPSLPCCSTCTYADNNPDSNALAWKQVGPLEHGKDDKGNSWMYFFGPNKLR